MQKIVLAVKKSFYERYGEDLKDPHFLDLMKTHSPISQDLREAHDEHQRAVEGVTAFLERVGVVYERRSVVNGSFDERGDLVVSVGGDGTLLAVSHGVTDTPVLGINSRPGRSVGYFCGADVANFEAVLGRILEGKESPRELLRMDLLVNGEKLNPPALNDLLFASQCPAATTVFGIAMDEVRETQRGSGVWISTPAGSTAGILAAGGEKMDIEGKRLQYRTREPSPTGRDVWRLHQGFFERGLSLTNLTPEAAVFVDGTRIVHPVNYGDTIQPRVSDTPLRIYL